MREIDDIQLRFVFSHTNRSFVGFLLLFPIYYYYTIHFRISISCGDNHTHIENWSFIEFQFISIIRYILFFLLLRLLLLLPLSIDKINRYEVCYLFDLLI